ncbi:enoyl-CoA hydratase/isomerase family protein [Aeromicrobium panaciterrae]|uniref:enoyl-CoA hydratase/isomerase family protein n=1 Tax=Aeromicrobium panaciterrae TaxID=363861 RepID=UPI0031E1DD67
MSVTLDVDATGVARITLDRPVKRNALDNSMLEQLAGHVAEIGDRDDVRVVVLRGAGGTFCAGADIADWVDPSYDQAMKQSRLGSKAFAALADLPQVTVGVIEGTAVGGGLELALACDLRITTDDAVLGLPELGLGNLPSWGGVARLADISGHGVARHLLLSGELIDGRRAAELLVVTSSHAVADLDAAVTTVVDRLLAAEPTATAMAKSLLGQLRGHLDLEVALAGFYALYEPSRARKHGFLERKAAARAARSAHLIEGQTS